MIELTRHVRFCVSQASPAPGSEPGRPASAYAGWPGMIGVGAFYELEVTCRGEPDADTGYLMNISRIDAAVQATAIPMIQEVFRRWPQRDPGRVLEAVYRALEPALDPTLVAVGWWLSPYYSVAIEAQAMDRVLISQQFEFSAAHRLHSPALDDAANRQTFGKCNNPSGHGHNYRLEPIISTPLNATDDPDVFNVSVLERIVDETVIERFDHTHLNLDTAEFAQLNPTVEHIAKVCYDLLEPRIAEAGGRLERVRVWETEKSSCTYPADGHRP